MENELEDIVTDDEAIDNEETELTVEDYKKEKEWRIKAVNKYVLPAKKLMEKYWVKTFEELEEKIQSKETTAGNTLSEKDLELRDEIRDFVKENPEFREYKDDLVEYAKTFYSKWERIESAIRKAKALVENDDKTIENRKKANLNISEWEIWGKKTIFTQEEIAKLPLEERAKKYEMFKAWKIKIK